MGDVQVGGQGGQGLYGCMERGHGGGIRLEKGRIGCEGGSTGVSGTLQDHQEESSGLCG